MKLRYLAILLAFLMLFYWSYSFLICPIAMLFIGYNVLKHGVSWIAKNW